MKIVAEIRGRIIAALALFVAGMLLPLPAIAAIEPGPGKAWLVIASRSNQADAIALARRYAGRFPTAAVFLSNNGFYAVTLGWSGREEGAGLLENLKAQGAVPGDAYFHNGERYFEAVWTANDAHHGGIRALISGAYLFGAGQAPPQAGGQQQSPSQQLSGEPGYVTGLNPQGDNYLSLRLGPGTSFRELARMRPDTELTLHAEQGGWVQVALANGMSGWASARYVARGRLPPAIVRNGNQANENIPLVGPQKKPDPQPDPQQEVAKLPEANAGKVEEKKPQKAIADQKRVALVIGNSAYRHAIELPNPRNDAAAISDKLQALGFSVTVGLDGSKAEMETAIREFVKAMAGADVVLLFYAGHGMQVSGVNYLIPVDAKLEDATALDFETINLNTVLSFMNAEKRISIALLDACRDNPLSRRFARSLGATRSAFIGRGLAAPNSGSGETLIGFATAPGEVALDGDTRNSPFTNALLNHIDAKGLEIELMLKRVKDEVYRSTNEAQEPWHNSALRQEFYFNPAN